MSDYSNRIYCMTAVSSVDELTIHKARGSEWTTIEMVVNGEATRITIRSRSHLVMLRTMIDESLGDSQ